VKDPLILRAKLFHDVLAVDAMDHIEEEILPEEFRAPRKWDFNLKGYDESDAHELFIKLFLE